VSFREIPHHVHIRQNFPCEMASWGSGRKRVTKELSKEDAEREEAGSAVELGAGDRQK